MAKKDGRLLFLKFGGNTMEGQITGNMSIDIDEILATTKDSAGHKERLMGEDSISFDFEAAYDPAAAANTAFDDLVTLALAKSSAVVYFGEITTGGLYFTCTGFISNLTLGAPKNDLTTYTGTFVSSGALTSASVTTTTTT
jgi:hypothetical protein